MAKKVKKKRPQKQILLVVALLVLLISGFFLYEFTQTKRQDDEFTSSRQMKNSLVEALKTKNDVLQVDNLDNCYYARPNEFDDNKLFCSTYSAVYVTAHNLVEANNIVTETKKNLTDVFNTSLTRTLSTKNDKEVYENYVFQDKKNDKDCNLNFRFPLSDTVGYYLPKRDYPDTMSVLIGCNGHARKSYFKFDPSI